LGFRAASSVLRVSCFVFQIAGFRFWVSGSGFSTGRFRPDILLKIDDVIKITIFLSGRANLEDLRFQILKRQKSGVGLSKIP